MSAKLQNSPLKTHHYLLDETRYCLWLKPSGAAYDALVRTIRDLARELDAPSFEPHVTLLDGLGGREEEHLRRCDTLARLLQPFPVVLTEPGYRDTYFQCVFMLVQQTQPLMMAHGLAARTFGRAGGTYMPHVSLLYGSYSDARKSAIIDLLPADVRTSFEAGSFHLIRVGSADPKDWQEIRAFAMSRRSAAGR